MGGRGVGEGENAVLCGVWLAFNPYNHHISL